MTKKTVIWLSVLLVACGWLAGCERERERCGVDFNVRLAVPNPLSGGGDTGDVAWVRLTQDGAVAWEDTIDLGGRGQPGGGDVMLHGITGEDEPETNAGSTVSFEMSAYSSANGNIVAVGRTQNFTTCSELGDDMQVPMYLGPANGFAPTRLTDERDGGEAVPLLDGRVFVFGGISAFSYAIYDHMTGQWCADCIENAPAASRIGHTATPLSDGRVLIVGGTDAAGTAQTDVLVFDPASNSFVDPGITLDRTGHAAVLLAGVSAVSNRDRGKVLIAGGTVAEAPTDSLVVIDVDAGSATQLEVSLSSPRRDLAATLLTSGEVVISGGRDAADALSGAVDIYVDGEVLSADFPCSGNSAPDMLCARRAGHKQLVLPDGNLLIVGGDVQAPAGGEAPGAEVFLLADRTALPSTSEPSELPARSGHVATLTSCQDGSCPVLIAGGRDLDGLPAAPVLFHLNLEGATRASPSYGGTVTDLGDVTNDLDRLSASAALLSDGTVLIAGGTSTTSVDHRAGLVFSLCERPLGQESLSCP
jgi:hypothetical protein